MNKLLNGKTIDQITIERLQEFEPPEGYYLAFSGGKDSIVLKHLSDKAGVKYDAHYSVTTIDPPDLIYFIRKHYPDVIWDRPKEPFLKMLSHKGLPLRQARWCCELYKENGGEGRLVLTGIRWRESNNRSKRKMTEHCLKDKSKRLLHPIIDWTADDIWQYIRENKLPYCKLYDEGWRRIGCLFCPMQSSEEKHKQVILYPAIARAFERAMQQLKDLRKRQGRPSCDEWTTGKEMFEWYISGKGKSTGNEGLQLYE